MKGLKREIPIHNTELILSALTPIAAVTLIFQCADIYITGRYAQNAVEVGAYIHGVYGGEIVIERMSNISCAFFQWLVVWIFMIALRAWFPEVRRKVRRLSAENQLALAFMAQLRENSAEGELKAAQHALKRKPEPLEKRKTPLIPIARMPLYMAAAVLIISGIMNGGMYDAMVKAINICTECVGLG